MCSLDPSISLSMSRASCIIFLFVFFSSNIFASNNNVFHGSFEKLKNEFQYSNNISFNLANISFTSDIPFSKNEFSYLVDLKVGKTFMLKDLSRVYKRLKRKKRFNSINVEIKELRDGTYLHFDFVANWVFKKLDLRGVWFDKYQYEELYLQQAGDNFDISLHEESVQAIKKLLYDKGYFSCDVEDELVYEKTNKFVTVKIKILPGRSFKINEVDFDLNNIKDKKSAVNRIVEKLRKNFNDNLIGTSYSKRIIEKEVRIVRDYLRKKGYLSCRLKVRRFINKKMRLVKIIFDIELGKKCKIKFKGNSFFSKQQIKRYIASDERPSWLFTPQVIAEQLIQEYYKKGFWNIKIDYEIYPDGIALFKINEGRQVSIDFVEIKDSIKNILTSKEFFFHELLLNGSYDEDLFNLGLQNLKNFYVQNGFWDFKFIEKRFIKCDKNDSYSIVITVEKGIQRFFDGIKINGFEYLQSDLFFKKYENSMPFDVSWIAQQRVFLLNYFQKKGHWYVDVNPEFIESKINLEKTNVSVVWNVDLGNIVRFGKLLLRGNTSLPFKRILKELRFMDGDLWDKTKLDLTSSRFKKLDLFKVVQFQPYKVAKTSDVKPVILTLVDDDPYEIRFRAGYFLTSKNFLLKQQSTYKIGSSFVFKNPTNSADKLILNVDITRFERNLNADYQLPSPFGLPIISTAKAYSIKYTHPVQIGKSGSAYEAIQNGFLVGLSNEYKRNYFWGLNVGDEWMETSKVRGNLNFSPELVDKTIPYFFIEPSLVIDTLDDKLNSTNGALTFASLKTMVPHRNTQTTFKLMVEQSFLKPIYGDVIGGLRIRWGHIFRRDFEDVMPIERFYLGGPYSVRGYEIDSLPPLGLIEKNENAKLTKEYTIQGGSSMINGSVEVRFPIFKSFKGVVFHDIGVLSQSGFSGFKGTWYPATGFGFRYKTPIGPIRFDIGWKWKKRLPGDCAYAWYLTIGEAF